ncbi:MAG: 4-hydroxythreonine-4-phosphate dehydrogenase PdxA [Candidatus Thioglobus sp.]|jgi:4-hydroxythreonine-4-phosphate dehydrogenase|nr:4-hydroxythreonine-4-phosphate dehydrogenase PdxA [Candidatus Thioglobus sp.]|tara:strand:+ start:322 stop:1284 length:963 start_codon:yes stop_codon:yes gene_type:complete
MAIAYTPGEPSGIGPDLVIMYAQKSIKKNLLVYCDPDVLIDRAKQLNLPISLKESNPEICNKSELNIYPIRTDIKVEPGKLESNNAAYVLNTLNQATKDCLSGRCDGLLTGPVNKGIINESGVLFSGHTEFLAKLSGVSRTVMLLATKELKVALATTHLPLKEVSNHITRKSLKEVITIIKNSFIYFGINNPHILVCGLNPHAGEDGHLGDEEVNVINPVISELNDLGYNLTGPVPADTAFTSKSLSKVDVVLTMYHDQGLPVLKAQGFNQAANITLGLPFFRTSVDHGTAIELAGTGRISLGSFNVALQYLEELQNNAT